MFLINLLVPGRFPGKSRPHSRGGDVQLHLQAFLAALAAGLVLAVSIGTAFARRLQFSELFYRAVWVNLTAIPSEGGFNESTCAVTMEGSFHSRTISKVSGALIGYVTRVTYGHPCISEDAWALNGIERQNGVTVANTLPWHERYVGFLNVLPLITGMRTAVVGLSVLYRLGGLFNCLYKSTTASPAFFLDFFERGSAEEEAGPVPFLSGTTNCPASMRFTGTGTLTNLAGGAITLSLVV